MQSVIIVKLKIKTNQRTEICKYKTDNSSEGNLLPIRIFKAPYPKRKITYLNKWIDKK